MEPRRVAFATLGCKLNRADTEALRAAFEARGYVEVPFDADADVYVVNTCTVTRSTDHQCRQLIRRALARKAARPGIRVAVVGCYPQTASDELLHMTPGVDLVVGTADKERVAEWIDGLTGSPEIHVTGLQRVPLVPRPLPRKSGLTRALLRIQDGCDARCAYCIVPAARGPSRSELPTAVLAAAHSLAAAGHLELVLTGIHVGRYGLDLDPPASLAALLRDLAAAVPECRLRLSSLEPAELTLELLATAAALPSVCRHFHLSIQSLTDPTLRRMARPYTAADAACRVRDLASRFPDAAVGADLIVGFPGETDADFNATAALLEDLPFAYLHVFRYSPRPGTPAADMQGQVPEDVKKSRARRLAEIRSRKMDAFRRRFIGRELDVLVEHRRKTPGAPLAGATDNYLRVRLHGPDALMGRIVRVRILSADADALTGRPVGQA